MKATAVAHPIQGLIKYHGLADPVLRLPFHDSISVCTAPLTSRTTVEFGGVALPMSMIVALVPAFKQTDDAHREALTPPFFHARLAEMPRRIAEMELAIRRRAIGEICALAERDTLMLHGITMTGTGEMVLWQPDTLRVILAVRRLREAGVPAFFSIDTGATVYVNTLPDRADEVQKAIEELGIRTIPCKVGGPARIIGDHLF